MRGALSLLLSLVSLSGIIPAYAGSTYYLKRPAKQNRDHPRVCGEHCGPVKTQIPSGGSSPRMRGAHQGIDRKYDRHGIIPAYAGSTTAHWMAACATWDHPRVCGEHRLHPGRLRRLGGSSPRMRGALVSPNLFVSSFGIIPAYAGSTDYLFLRDGQYRDHPRVCGEHVPASTVDIWSLGSSPRMRGALRVRSGVKRKSGIIPAYAGSTCK